MAPTYEPQLGPKCRHLVWPVLAGAIVLLLVCEPRHARPARLVRELHNSENASEPSSANLYPSNGDQNDELTSATMACLDACAACVRQWRVGVYNGRQCANECINGAQELDAVEIIDPECKVKYFNSKILASS